MLNILHALGMLQIIDNETLCKCIGVIQIRYTFKPAMVVELYCDVEIFVEFSLGK